MSQFVLYESGNYAVSSVTGDDWSCDLKTSGNPPYDWSVARMSREGKQTYTNVVAYTPYASVNIRETYKTNWFIITGGGGGSNGITIYESLTETPTYGLEMNVVVQNLGSGEAKVIFDMLNINGGDPFTVADGTILSLKMVYLGAELGWVQVSKEYNA